VGQLLDEDNRPVWGGVCLPAPDQYWNRSMRDGVDGLWDSYDHDQHKHKHKHNNQHNHDNDINDSGAVSSIRLSWILGMLGWWMVV